MLELDDGSIWDVHYYGGIWRLFGWGWSEQSDVSHWDIGDKIEIKYPGSGNFADFVLIATNVPKVEKACVKLRQAPSPNCESCLWLFDYDEISKLITLNNGSKWVRTTADIWFIF